MVSKCICSHVLSVKNQISWPHHVLRRSVGQCHSSSDSLSWTKPPRHWNSSSQGKEQSGEGVHLFLFKNMTCYTRHLLKLLAKSNFKFSHKCENALCSRKHGMLDIFWNLNIMNKTVLNKNVDRIFSPCWCLCIPDGKRRNVHTFSYFLLFCNVKYGLPFCWF